MSPIEQPRCILVDDARRIAHTFREWDQEEDHQWCVFLLGPVGYLVISPEPARVH